MYYFIDNYYQFKLPGRSDGSTVQPFNVVFHTTKALALQDVHLMQDA